MRQERRSQRNDGPGGRSLVPAFIPSQDELKDLYAVPKSKPHPDPVRRRNSRIVKTLLLRDAARNSSQVIERSYVMMVMTEDGRKKTDRTCVMNPWLADAKNKSMEGTGRQWCKAEL